MSTRNGNQQNFYGTEWQLHDGAVPAGGRPELGAMVYETNFLGSKGPRQMRAAIPKLDANLNFVQPTSPASILQKLQARYSLHDCDSVTFGGLEERGGYDTHTVHWTYRNYQDIIVAVNKPPRWNDAVAAYVLDFAGRVTVASVKNFQLTDDIEVITVLLPWSVE